MMLLSHHYPAVYELQQITRSTIGSGFHNRSRGRQRQCPVEVVVVTIPLLSSTALQLLVHGRVCVQLRP
jgi:hypothetical protein